jgi:hypothetical protein
MRVVSSVGGLLLIAFGVLLVTGAWNAWMDSLRASSSGWFQL